MTVERLLNVAGLADAVGIVGVPHTASQAAKIMLLRAGVPKVNSLGCPVPAHWYEASFSLPWIVIPLRDPLQVAFSYERRRGTMHGVPTARGLTGQCPFEAFRAAWLGLQTWLQDATERGVYPHRTTVICMDRVRFPIWERGQIAQELDDLKTIAANKDFAALMKDGRVTQYVLWMRENRQIFEFVAPIGSYDLWWLGSYV